MANEDSGTFETRKDAGPVPGGTYRLWKTALDLAGEDEKDWRKKAQSAKDRYRAEKENRSSKFNILYSSVETQAPAIYNSTPEPDVRRRFGDEDPVGKVASEAFERSLSHCTDEYDFDAVMDAVVHDSLLPGRGVAIVVYEPVVGGTGVDYETVRTEHVQWDDFRRGPGKEWVDVPWVAIRYRITREAAIALNPKEGPTVTLDYVDKDTGEEKDRNKVPDVFKRLTIWKIWDKVKRQTVFIAPSFTQGAFATEEDQLSLKDFFPMPRPIYDIPDSSSLIPLVPFEMYRAQAEELDTITSRIRKLTAVLRWRGIRPSQIEELSNLKDADDGELVPSESFSALVMSQGARPDQAIWLMPIDRLIVVIQQLVVQRETIKQVIFEISGLADIMRGESDPNETLGAQQIKAQWGSLRMQKRQREVQRFARDLMRLKAEIIGEQFSVQTLSVITGIVLPTPEQKQAAQFAIAQAQQTQQQPPPEVMQAMQLPTWDEVKQVMASDALRSFKVDIETDSTIQADMTRSQQNMSQFVQGLAAFSEAIGPGIQAGLIPQDAAADLLTAFARQFKLGKQAEDALDRIGKQSQQQDPAADAAQQAAQAEQQKAQAEAQAAQQKAQAELAMAQQKMQGELEIKREQMQGELAIKREAAGLEAQLDQGKAIADVALKASENRNNGELN